jgi:hypothetical protein
MAQRNINKPSVIWFIGVVSKLEEKFLLIDIKYNVDRGVSRASRLGGTIFQ